MSSLLVQNELQKEYSKQSLAPLEPCGQCAVHQSNIDHKQFQLTQVSDLVVLLSYLKYGAEMKRQLLSGYTRST